MSNFIKKHSNIVSVFFGLFIAFLMLISAEIALWIVTKNTKPDIQYPKKYWTRDDFGIPEPRPGIHNSVAQSNDRLPAGPSFKIDNSE